MGKANFNLFASFVGDTSIAAASSSHPNEMKFSGVLVRLDEPSTKAPNGSNGHKILIPKALAAKKLNTLLGMGVNYSSDLEKHQPTRKVGVIKKAWIEGNAIKVSGIIWKKDFPDAVKDLKQANLGMSFEASNIDVKDAKADIWELSDLCFTGAAILYKASAAYYKTEALAASASIMSVKLIKTNNGGDTMADVNKKKKKTSVAASGQGLTAEALVAAITASHKPVLDALNTLIAGQATLTNTIQAAQAASLEAEAEAVLAAKKKKDVSDQEDDGDDDGEEEDEDDMESEADEDMESEADEEASADDEDELEDVDTEHDDEEVTPGHLNKNLDKNKGDKTTVSTKGNKNKNLKVAVVAGADLSSLRNSVKELVANAEEKDAEIERLQRKIRKSERSLEAAGDRVERRSVATSAQLGSLLAKEGIDTSTMSASGEKISVGEFDAVLAKGNLSSTQRFALKGEAAKLGIMDEGHVRRQTA